MPRSFHPDRGRGKEPLHLLSSRLGSRRRRSQIGVYDDHLVCAACEKRFDAFDDYAAKLLLDNVGNQYPLEEGGEIYAYQIEQFDYHKLKLFALSLLWRAAASRRLEFQRVDVGRFFPRLTNMVKAGIPGSPQTFATLICRFSDIPMGYSAVIYPTRVRVDGCMFYKFVMSSYVFYVKVDIGFVPEPLDILMVRPNAPLLILANEFTGGPEFRAMLRIAKAHASN